MNAHLPKGKMIRAALYCFFTICLLPIAIFSYKHPGYNWDMLGYIAVVVRMDGVKDISEIHRITYQSAKENIPPQDYKNLVDSPAHRVRFANDPSYFKEILPIHVVKPLYVWSVFLFYKIGFDLPKATVMPSIIAYFLIGLLLFHWMNKYLKPAFSFLSSLLIMISVFMITSARISSPDTVSAFFLVTAFYFFLEKKDPRWMFVFLLLAIFTRVDNIITGFLIITSLTFALRWEKRITRTQYLLMILILACSYLVIILPVCQFGWSIFYYPEYAKHMDFYRDFDKPLSLSEYFSFMYSKAITGLVFSHFTFFVFLSALLVFHPQPVQWRRLSFDQKLVILIIGIILIHFILLPDLSDRFYIAFYLVIIMILIRKIFKIDPDKPNLVL